MTEQVVTYKGRTFSIALLLIIGALVILLWWKSCGGNDNVNQDAIRLAAKATADSIAHEKKVKAIVDSLKEVVGEKELSDSMLKDAASDLEKMFRANEKLRADHAKTPAPIPFDSINSIVSNDYVKQCDNCFTSLKQLEDTVKSAKKLVEEREEINRRALILQNSEINVFRESLEKKNKDYIDLLDKFSKAAKPKASLSGGIEYSHSPVNANIGAYLTFRNKKGHEFSVDGGGNSQSSWYAGFRLGAKIF